MNLDFVRRNLHVRSGLLKHSGGFGSNMPRVYFPPFAVRGTTCVFETTEMLELIEHGRPQRHRVERLAGRVGVFGSGSCQRLQARTSQGAKADAQPSKHLPPTKISSRSRKTLILMFLS
jgi:hypothetical protein